MTFPFPGRTEDWNHNRTALLTGGSRGIGKATADMLRERGWSVVAPTRGELDFVDMNSLSTYLLDWIGGLNVPRFDVVVFCHGEWYSRSPWQSPHVDPAKVWFRQYTLRVFAPMFMLQFLLGGDARWRPGCVVMVSSTRGLIGGVDTGPYSAACAAQIALMQGYAREYPGTRFNAVAPGLTDTDMGREVIVTGGAKLDAVAQPPGVVAQVIVSLIEDGESNGRIVRIVDGKATEAKWSW